MYLDSISSINFFFIYHELWVMYYKRLCILPLNFDAKMHLKSCCLGICVPLISLIFMCITIKPREEVGRLHKQREHIIWCFSLSFNRVTHHVFSNLHWVNIFRTTILNWRKVTFGSFLRTAILTSFYPLLWTAKCLGWSPPQKWDDPFIKCRTKI